MLEVHKVSWKNPLNNGSERLAKCPIIVENGATTGLSAHFQGRSVEVCNKVKRGTSRSYLTKGIEKSVQIQLFRSRSVLSPTDS